MGERNFQHNLFRNGKELWWLIAHLQNKRQDIKVSAFSFSSTLIRGAIDFHPEFLHCCVDDAALLPRIQACEFGKHKVTFFRNWQ